MMQSAVPLMCLLLCATLPSAAVGQDTTPPPAAFDSVRPLLYAQPEVRLTDGAGRATRGTVVSVSETALTVRTSRSLLHPLASERVFAVGDITHLSVADSTWNGAFIGAAASAAVFGVWARACDTGECEQGRALTAVLGTFAGLGAGAAIDALFQRTIYERPRAALLLVPSLAPGRHAVLAELRW